MTRSDAIDAAVRPVLETVMKTAREWAALGLPVVDIETHVLAFKHVIRAEFTRIMAEPHASQQR